MRRNTKALTSIDSQFDREVSAALAVKIPAATADQRLTLLSLLEDPRLYQMVESLANSAAA